ncbi:hypothetical protein, partial [Halovibrio sp. HP20-50]|uniref:hypothetical protein n=1 Tax=Halovibrio sp. HP20-59 TaxID=3080275 RepID=UPI00294B29AF
DRIASLGPVHRNGQETAIEALQNRTGHGDFLCWTISGAGRSRRHRSIYFLIRGQRDASSDWKA